MIILHGGMICPLELMYILPSVVPFLIFANYYKQRFVRLIKNYFNKENNQ
jgi:hypothetical protein